MMEMGLQDLAQPSLVAQVWKNGALSQSKGKMTQITIRTCSSVITYEAAAAELQATEAHQ